MGYRIVITTTAEKQLDKLPEGVSIPLYRTIASLAGDPRPHGHKKLKGSKAFRVRCGNYRVIYEIEDGILVVHVIAVGHRKDVYRHLK